MSDQSATSAAEHLEAVLLHTLFEHHPDRIYFKDEQSRFIHISHAQATSFGLADWRSSATTWPSCSATWPRSANCSTCTPRPGR
ncbi:MAG TPA: hypothetical protein VEA69_13870 [Tepidisphaeraceae bacterium]|nr:hypothetical protein [Tepidisphaeraceae bacterium]